VNGLNLLKEGLIWCIGDGKTVRIWRDNWLPRTEELKMLGEKGRSRLIRVSSLIDEGGCDKGLLRHTFPPIDVEAILKIKLSPRRHADFLAWRHESNGLFSVRSAYRLGLRLSQQGGTFATSSAAPKGYKPIWKVI
jgi:hypothetical protein